MNEYLAGVNAPLLFALVAVVLGVMSVVCFVFLIKSYRAGLKYFAKSLRLSAPPLVLMSILCIAVPSLISQTSTMMIPVGAMALALGYVLWRKDKL